MFVTEHRTSAPLSALEWTDEKCSKFEISALFLQASEIVL